MSRWVADIAGVPARVMSTLAGLAFLLVGWVAGRRRFHGAAVRLAGADVTPGRALTYLALRVPVGLLGGLLTVLCGWGAITVAMVLHGWFTGRPVDDIAPTPLNVGYILGAAAVLAFLGLQGLRAVARMDEALAARLLAPDPLRRRIAELSAARAEVVAAVDAERRRIERDLHDGVQQRLVALGMLLGRARRATGDQVTELLRQAHEEAADALVDLREVSWRVFPHALDAGGLPAALETVADRSPVPVRLDVELADRPESAAETVAYFVISEAVTNAVKHAGAGAIDVTVRRVSTDLRVTVRDDGGGGADPGGGGLTGLARRVSALDGAFTVTSPPGGPTTIGAVLPCG